MQQVDDIAEHDIKRHTFKFKGLECRSSYWRLARGSTPIVSQLAMPTKTIRALLHQVTTELQPAAACTLGKIIS